MVDERSVNNRLDDLKDNPKEIAEDIIKQAKSGFSTEAEQRIVNIISIYRDNKAELEESRLQIANLNSKNDSTQEDEGWDEFRD